jgi:hypothetical protein
MDLMENFQETIDENLLWILPYPILLSHCPSLWWLNLFFMFKPLSLMLKTMLNHVNPYVWWFKTTIVEGQKWKVHLDVGLSDSKNMHSMLEISWRSFYLHVELGQNRQFPHIFLGQTIPFFSLILPVSEDFHLPGLVNCPRKRTGKIHHFLWLNLAKSTISKRPFPSSQTVDITRGLSDLPVFYIFFNLHLSALMPNSANTAITVDSSKPCTGFQMGLTSLDHWECQCFVDGYPLVNNGYVMVIIMAM